MMNARIQGRRLTRPVTVESMPCAPTLLAPSPVPVTRALRALLEMLGVQILMSVGSPPLCATVVLTPGVIILWAAITVGRILAMMDTTTGGAQTVSTG